MEGVEGPRVRDKKKKVEELKKKAREASRSGSHRPGVIRDDEDGMDVAIVSFDELGPMEVRPERGSNWAGRSIQTGCPRRTPQEWREAPARRVRPRKGPDVCAREKT